VPSPPEGRHVGSRRAVLEGRRFWEQQLRTLVRGLLFAFWALALWGTLLLLALAWAALTRGLAEAAAAVSALSLLNLLCCALAAAAWVTVLASLRRGKPSPASDPARGDR
jgi:hypothetical protein